MIDRTEIFSKMVGKKPRQSTIDDHFERLLVDVEHHDATDASSQPLTFSIKPDAGYAEHDLEEAVRRTRMGYDIGKSNRPLTGDDFTDFLSRILLAELGYFSCDLPEHRALREKQATKLAYLEEAYEVLGLDRKEQHRLIAAKLEGTRKDGIWARSTREYGEACDRLDRAIVAASPAIERSLVELG